MIPYFIAVAHPDYKRPSTEIMVKTCPKEELRETILLDIVNVYFNTLDSLDRFSSLKEIIDSYYCDYYMDQEPVYAKYFDTDKNEWREFGFTDEEFFNLYKEYADNLSD